jgi:hypothetical protein
MDFGGGTVWEQNAWYHDRKGNHLPVGDALKTHPRKGQARGDQPQPAAAQTIAAAQPTPPAPTVDKPFASLSTNTETITKLSSFGRLADYPRPPGDNGRGIHYAPTIMGQPTNQVDFFIEELRQLNIKWLKIMQGDTAKVEHPYLIEQLVANDMEPIVRVYKPYNEPYQNLEPLVRDSVALGAHYFELHNEPNIGGFPGGWRDGEEMNIDRLLDLWIPAAEAIQKAGGYPACPLWPPAANGRIWIFCANSCKNWPPASAPICWLKLAAPAQLLPQPPPRLPHRPGEPLGHPPHRRRNCRRGLTRPSGTPSTTPGPTPNRPAVTTWAIPLTRIPTALPNLRPTPTSFLTSLAFTSPSSAPKAARSRAMPRTPATPPLLMRMSAP